MKSSSLWCMRGTVRRQSPRNGERYKAFVMEERRIFNSGVAAVAVYMQAV